MLNYPTAANHLTYTSSTPMTQEPYIYPKWYHYQLVEIEPIDNTVNDLDAKQSLVDNETQEASNLIHKACLLRDKWLYKNIKNNGHIGSLIEDDDSFSLNIKDHKLPKSIKTEYSYNINDGIPKIYFRKKEIFKLHSFNEYISDLSFLLQLMVLGAARTLSYERLKILQMRFQLHLLSNGKIELRESSSIPYRDFYNVRKIDNHIHHSACMTQKYLLDFIKNKYKKEPNKIVLNNNKTLRDIFTELNIPNINYLTVDKLGVQCQSTQTFQRFDKFNAKYNPLGQRALRKVFLKYNNFNKGEYLAEMTKSIINELEESKYQYCEYRVTIHGTNICEWDIISDWICNHKIKSSHVRWLIQIPRNYHIFRNKKLINNFNEMLFNIFSPLFEVTLNPLSHPSLYLFLQIMVGFDSVDDESIPDYGTNGSINDHMHFPSPINWNNNINPPYIYYMYYMWINIFKLNKLREERGFNTFGFRPHSGEAGSLNHLASAFLFANSINHGIRLKSSPILQYLYYLKQIGISMSPLSNNILFKSYSKNPFPLLFQRGLNVTLSTDDPLLIHYTKDPLLEEYSIAAQVYKLSTIDLNEIARNSVFQSGWDHKSKQMWIGDNYNHIDKSKSNDIYKTNIPNTRIQFRYAVLKEEIDFVQSNCSVNHHDDIKISLNNIILNDINIGNMNDINNINNIHGYNDNINIGSSLSPQAWYPDIMNDNDINYDNSNSSFNFNELPVLPPVIPYEINERINCNYNGYGASRYHSHIARDSRYNPMS